MASQHIDIEQMVMRARYEMHLEKEASSVKGGHLSDMERKDYQKRIDDLLNAVTTLLDANNAMGEKLQKLEKIADAYEDLKVKYAKVEGDLAMRKRSQHGKKSEKPKDSSESNPASDGSKDADEEKYVENNWKALTAYLNVGSVLIDNRSTYGRLQGKNCCERAVRPFANLRKCFGGFSSEKGGEVAAAWLTFIETCKLQKKAALDFFNEFFRQITEGRSDYELIAQEVLG